MTAIVGIRCKDGVVIGADSSATFGDGGGRGIIGQSTRRKIEIIGESVIVAGTGAVGHMQRFTAVIQNLWGQKAFQGKNEIEIGKLLSSSGINDFHQTGAMNNLQFAAMVAYPANDQPSLCELPGGPGIFQPEIKKVDDLWFASTGSGQSITDPFLALLRKVNWHDEAPSPLSAALRSICSPAFLIFSKRVCPCREEGVLIASAQVLFRYESSMSGLSPFALVG